MTNIDRENRYVVQDYKIMNFRIVNGDILLEEKSCFMWIERHFINTKKKKISNRKMNDCIDKYI
jgi:hypothetical protein